ncbi:sporulation protein YabP [Clostridium collagenovorans DSM 3089]|uniref:Sporulation protein YabP n=1 Tax=Clostridium collagenovorans DSM 3089 TaxID=1121306 RepID=A0A1M5Y824_9CLOT|nr:sporulation protein YabP [Clostridium collagenovorans]SHI08079.1 sporulation protein YabP [Clostridium collagenovorans DSM 3089]
MESKKDFKKGVQVEENLGDLSLINRSKLHVTGVLEVISFTEDEIDLITKGGNLTIEGKNLKMNKLDVVNGEVNITGTLNSFVYSENRKVKKKDSILSRLFR